MTDAELDALLAGCANAKRRTSTDEIRALIGRVKKGVDDPDCGIFGVAIMTGNAIEELVDRWTGTTAAARNALRPLVEEVRALRVIVKKARAYRKAFNRLADDGSRRNEQAFEDAETAMFAALDEKGATE